MHFGAVFYNKNEYLDNFCVFLPYLSKHEGLEWFMKKVMIANYQLILNQVNYEYLIIFRAFTLFTQTYRIRIVYGKGNDW